MVWHVNNEYEEARRNVTISEWLEQVISRKSARSLSNRRKRLLTDTDTTEESVKSFIYSYGTKILFDSYKHRYKRVQPLTIYRLPKALNSRKGDHWNWRFRNLWSRRKKGWYYWRQSTVMGRCRGGCGRVRGSGRGRISVIVRGQYETSNNEIEKSGLSKSPGNSMFAYGEKNSTNEIWTTWEKVVQHIWIALGQDIST